MQPTQRHLLLKTPLHTETCHNDDCVTEIVYCPYGCVATAHIPYVSVLHESIPVMEILNYTIFRKHQITKI